jgi:hypothetical protein
VLGEVQARRGSARLGAVDSVIHVGGLPVPVEVKLSAAAAVGLPRQLARYSQAELLVSGDVPMRTMRHGVVVVIDGSGVFLTKRGRFHQCSISQPYLERTSVNKRRLRDVQRELTRLIKHDS